MYIVYWSILENEDQQPSRQIYSELFTATEMTKALSCMEALRKRKYDNGEKIFGITMAAEHPDSVGMLGVDVTGPDYDWKKRRL